MKIINLMSLQKPDIKPELRKLANDCDRVIALKGQMLLDLVALLEADGPAPAAFGHISGHTVWLSPTNQYNRSRVQVTVDWPDYGRLHDGIPTMHYRLNVSRRVGGPTRDARFHDITEVKRFIWQAFGWSRSSHDPGDLTESP